MTDKIICPICGSENQGDARFCQVCQTDLLSLPAEMAPQRISSEAAKPVEDTAKTEPDTEDTVIPRWLQERFKRAKNDEPAQNDSFENYLGVLFSGAAAAERPLNDDMSSDDDSQKKTMHSISERQLSADYASKAIPAEDAAVEEADDDVNDQNDFDDDIYKDFSTFSPVRKWDDPQEELPTKGEEPDVAEVSDTAYEKLPTEDPFEKNSAALFEPGEDDDDDQLDADASFNDSVSISKLAEGAALTGLNDNGLTELEEERVELPVQPELPIQSELPMAADETNEDEEPVESQGPFQDADASEEADENENLDLDDGNLVSDFMRQFDDETQPVENDTDEISEGTLFFNGDSDEQDVLDGVVSETERTDADILNELLLNEGYHLETEDDQLSQADVTEPAPEESAEEVSDTEADETAVPVTSFAEETAETTESQSADVQEDLDEIPWNLFESGEMNLPTGSVPPVYRTFSRSGIPADVAETDYQQRMISNLLDKIIQLEGHNQPPEKSKKRAGGRVGQLICALLAIVGVLFILLSGVTDQIKLVRQSSSPAVAVFTDLVSKTEGKALIAIEYTPAYSDELEQATVKLIKSLSGQGCKIELVSLNPASMGVISQFERQYPEQITASTYLPGGAAAIQTLSFENEQPGSVFLVTADPGSLKNWAEQLQLTMGDVNFGAISSSQNSALLMPYIDSGLLDAAITNMDERAEFSENDLSQPADSRRVFALWFLIIYAMLCWLTGCVVRFMHNEPDYARMPKSINSRAALSYGSIPSAVHNSGRTNTSARASRSADPAEESGQNGTLQVEEIASTDHEDNAQKSETEDEEDEE